MISNDIFTTFFRRMCLTFGMLIFCSAGVAGPSGAGARCRLPELISCRMPAVLKAAAGTLEHPLAVHRRKLVSAPEGKDAFLKLLLSDAGTPSHPQGYTLDIAANGITVAARTPEGLFNGAQALADMLLRAASPELPVRRVSETPVIAERAIALSANTITSARKVRVLKRFLNALAVLRYNRVFLEFDDNFPDSRDLFQRRERRLGAPETADIAKFARAHFIEPVPMLTVWGNCPMLRGSLDRIHMRAAKADLTLNLSYCTRNQKLQELLRETIRRQCALLRAGEFAFRIDWKLLKTERCRCALCRDAGLAELAAEHLAFLAKCAADAGARPVFVLLNFEGAAAAEVAGRIPAGAVLYSTGGNRPNACATADPEALPRRIAEAARNRATRFAIFENDDDADSDFTELRRTTPDFLGGVVVGGFAMWSPAASAAPADPVWYLNRIISRRPHSIELNSATPVAIWDKLTAELGSTGRFPRFADRKALDELRRALRATPERFELAAGFDERYYGIALSYSSLTENLPEDTELQFGNVKAARFALLACCSVPRDSSGEDVPPSERIKFGFPQIAEIAIGYADGTSVKVPLRYRLDLSCWDEYYGGYRRRNAAVGRDAAGRRFRFDTVTVDNPSPDKAVTALRFRSLNRHGISPVLLAVSLIDMTEGKIPGSDPCGSLLHLNFRPAPDKAE